MLENNLAVAVRASEGSLNKIRKRIHNKSLSLKIKRMEIATDKIELNATIFYNALQSLPLGQRQLRDGSEVLLIVRHNFGLGVGEFNDNAGFCETIVSHRSTPGVMEK